MRCRRQYNHDLLLTITLFPRFWLLGPFMTTWRLVLMTGLGDIGYQSSGRGPVDLRGSCVRGDCLTAQSSSSPKFAGSVTSASRVILAFPRTTTSCSSNRVVNCSSGRLPTTYMPATCYSNSASSTHLTSTETRFLPTPGQR
jgi:hypothetical protein